MGHHEFVEGLEGGTGSKAGTLGWAACGLGILAFDTLAPETMSSAFRRGLENHRTAIPVIGAWAITSAHLFGALPERIDPFIQTFNVLERVRDYVGQITSQ